MKLRHLVCVILLKYLVAQDVKVPGDLLSPKTTTSNSSIEYDDYEDTTLEPEESAESTTITTKTTTTTRIVDTTKGSWVLDNNNFIPKSDKLTDNTIPLYVNPQFPKSFPKYTQYPQYKTSNCNNNNKYPNYLKPLSAVIPPTYGPKTIEPELEKTFECPIGFTKSGLDCVPFYSNNCPNNYIWKDNKCVSSQTVCPLNFEYDGISCIERQICPPNHIWENGRCISPEPQCPAGWQWNGEKCEIINIQCQPGYVLKGKECVIERIICPNGFNLVNDECVRPTPVCLPGYELQESGFCLKVSKKCPPGTVMVNEKCQETSITCLPGYERIGEYCYKIVQPPTESATTPFPKITTTTRPIVIYPIDPPVTIFPPDEESTTIPIDYPQSTCPKDYIFYNGQCYKCPINYVFCNGRCLRRRTPCNLINSPTISLPHSYPNIPIPNINIHLTMPNQDVPNISPPRSDMKPINIINNIEPINNTIYNINNVTHPVTLNNVNENNVYVHMDTQCADGEIRTTIIKNNKTIVGCEDNNNAKQPQSTTVKSMSTTENLDDDSKQQKCCEVVTPRRCKKRFTNQWMCTHRRYKYCGDFCTANRVYIKPPATVYSNQILTIAPPPTQTYIKPCFDQDCPAVDCSGCIDGSFNCSPQCYTYPCFGEGCTYINQNDFCEDLSDKEFCDR